MTEFIEPSTSVPHIAPQQESDAAVPVVLQYTASPLTLARWRAPVKRRPPVSGWGYRNGLRQTAQSEVTLRLRFIRQVLPLFKRKSTPIDALMP